MSAGSSFNTFVNISLCDDPSEESAIKGNSSAQTTSFGNFFASVVVELKRTREAVDESVEIFLYISEQ